MKLYEELRFNVEDHLGMDAIHEDDPVASELRDIFGDHTFFLDDSGLYVVVQIEVGAPEVGNIVKVASWAEDCGELLVHTPEIMPVIVDLMPVGPDSAV